MPTPRSPAWTSHPVGTSSIGWLDRITTSPVGSVSFVSSVPAPVRDSRMRRRGVFRRLWQLRHKGALTGDRPEMASGRFRHIRHSTSLREGGGPEVSQLSQLSQEWGGDRRGPNRCNRSKCSRGGCGNGGLGSATRAVGGGPFCPASAGRPHSRISARSLARGNAPRRFPCASQLEFLGSRRPDAGYKRLT